MEGNILKHYFIERKNNMKKKKCISEMKKIAMNEYYTNYDLYRLNKLAEIYRKKLKAFAFAVNVSYKNNKIRPIEIIYYDSQYNLIECINISMKGGEK